MAPIFCRIIRTSLTEEVIWKRKRNEWSEGMNHGKTWDESSGQQEQQVKGPEGGSKLGVWGTAKLWRQLEQKDKESYRTWSQRYLSTSACATRRTLDFVLHVMRSYWKVWAGEYMIWFFKGHSGCYLGIVWWGKATETNWERERNQSSVTDGVWGSQISSTFSDSHHCLLLSFWRLIPTYTS